MRAETSPRSYMVYRHRMRERDLHLRKIDTCKAPLNHSAKLERSRLGHRQICVYPGASGLSFRGAPRAAAVSSSRIIFACFASPPPSLDDKTLFASL